MAYWSTSSLAYDDISTVTDGRLNTIEQLNTENKTYELEVEVTPNKSETWQLVRALDDKETSTQAYAFKKGNEIVIAYRGSQELQDWFDTDPNYLVFNGNQPPALTRAKIELVKAPRSITLGIIDKNKAKSNGYKKKNLNNAFDVATQFAIDVKNDFPDCVHDTTGHSLGGAIATYVRVMAIDASGFSFIRQTITYAAPNVYGMFPKNIQAQIDEGIYQHNTIDFTDARDTFGTLNDRFPQVGVQHIIDNEKIWLLNHKLPNFQHLFLDDGEIRLTPETIRQLALKAENLHERIVETYHEVDYFNEVHDEAILNIQKRFEGLIGTQYDRLQITDVRAIIEKLSQSSAGSVPKFYDTRTEEQLLASLHDLRIDALDIKENLVRMATNFEEKDQQLANWLSMNPN